MPGRTKRKDKKPSFEGDDHQCSSSDDDSCTQAGSNAFSLERASSLLSESFPILFDKDKKLRLPSSDLLTKTFDRLRHHSSNATIPPALNKTLHKFVIQEKESGWEFQNMFVLEFTTFNMLLIVAVLCFWIINRQTHMRPTKGSRITRKYSAMGSFYNYDDDDDDENGENSDSEDEDEDHGDEKAKETDMQQAATATPTKIRRQSTYQQRLQLLNQIAGLDTEEDEAEDFPHAPPDSTLEGIPLTKEKRGLLKVLKDIKLFSYLDEEAMALCLEHVELLQLNGGQAIFERGNYDGSLYAVMSGRVRCRFHKYRLPDEEASDPEEEIEYQRLFGSTYGKGQVVTSLLAMMTGMVHAMTQQSHNNKRSNNNTATRDKTNSLFSIMPIAKDISAVVLDEATQLVRVSPLCFAQVMERYPANVYRIAQTALTRAQRLTVLTLVQTLGLRRELIVPPPPQTEHNKKPVQSSHIFRSRQQQDNTNPLTWALFGPENSNQKPSGEADQLLKEQACLEFAEILGIPVHKDNTESINILKEYCQLLNLSKGHELIKSGDTHDACYLLLDGTMELGLQIPVPSANNKRETSWHFQSFQTIPPGNLIGEHTCFSGDLSLFHVVCGNQGKSNNNDNGSTLLKVPRHVYLHLIRRHPSAMAKSLKGILQQVSSEVHLLNWTSEWMYVEAAEEIITRGDPCNSMFVVLNGRLRSAVSSRQKRLDPRLHDLEFGRGKIVGEVGCLTRSNWEFTLYAIRNSEIVRVQMRTLLVIIGEFPGAGMNFARAIAGSVAEHFFSPNKKGAMIKDKAAPAAAAPRVMRSYGLRLATIAVVPLTDSVSMDSFSSFLVNSFAEIAPCKLLTKQFIRGELGEKVYRNRNLMRQLRMTRLLADVEENYRLVVYQADQKYTWWTRLCIQQADCILLVVNAEHAPSLRRVEQSLEWAHKSINVRIDLVVVGSQSQDSEDDDDIGTDAYLVEDEEMTVSDQLNNWSEKRKWISGHHLVRMPFRRYPMDFRRLCRRVSGRAVGLVLGAGGARGLAHVGVIKALKEAGVTVDLVGGTSQGAFVGSLFARQPDDYKQCEEACRKMAMDMSSIRNKAFDLTLPMTSMFSGRIFNRGIRKRLGKIRIQDLVLNFFCVSVDLQKQQQVVHTKGILWKYVRASMSLTQYLPPVAENGTLLVDGGYMNVLPVDVMREQMNPRIVIACDVGQEAERDYYDYGTSLSGWWLLWNSWNPFVKTVQVPSMGDISDMLIWVSSERHRRTMKLTSDLYLTPPVNDIGTLEYDRFDELVQMGYQHAKPLVEEFVRKNPWIVTEPSPREKKQNVVSAQS